MSTPTPDDSETLATNGAPLVERTTLPGGTVLADRYRIQEIIGEGGMGSVYRATHLEIDEDVAIKVLAPEQMRRPRTVGRFLQEAKAASKIRHDNVVDITDYGESDGCAFFVMEYLAGEDLSQRLKREGRLPWARIKPICIQLLEALEAAHAANVVHRDIKPHNIFLTPRGGTDDFVKVIDFGIAKLYGEGSEEQLTQTGAIVGTAEYMSPEQGMGHELDGRSDLYSVGVILHRMLTGEVPYRGSNPMSILYQHIHADRVPPSKACPEAEIEPDLDALVLRAMARDRDDRFASAADFITAIEAVGTGAAVVGSTAGRGLPSVWVLGALTSVLGLVSLGWVLLGEQREPISAGSRPQPGVTASATAPSSAAGEATPDEPSTLITAAPAASTTAAEPALELPARRSSREIRSRLSKVDAKVRACGKKAGLFPGESVEVRVEIAPGGRVRAAEVQGAFSRKGAACIEDAVRSTRFSEVRNPQSARHRFTL